MKKGDQLTSEKSKNNLEKTNQSKIQIDEGKKEKEKKVENSQKNEESKEKNLEIKSKILNKPKELLDFDGAAHFKENLNRTDKNCIEPITEKTYYCIQCQHSLCPYYTENKNQKDHLLIKKAKFLLYDTNFFTSIDNNINEALTYKQQKKDIKECLTNSINILKDELDKLKEKKFKEIDDFFEETDKYLLEVKNKYLEVRKAIEEYYKVNKKFFNIEINKEINDDMNTNKEKKEKNLTNIENNNKQNNINIEDINNGTSNRDIENDVFLLNFEMMNLCETKNLEIMNKLSNLKNQVISFNLTFQKDLTKNVDIISNFFPLNTKTEKIEDYYWDVIERTKKYTEMIHQFRDIIKDIYHRTGNLEKLKDLIDILDSKLKKNNNLIFDQKYFKENNNSNEVFNGKNRGPGSPKNERGIKKMNHSRANSKKNLYSHRGKSANKLKRNADSTKSGILRNNYGSLTLSNDIDLMSLNKNKNDNLKTEIGTGSPTYNGNLEHKKTSPISTFQKILSFNNVNADDIILDQRVIERFFAYSISEMFSKNFIQLDSNNKDNFIFVNKDNIYLKKNKILMNKLLNSLNDNQNKKMMKVNKSNNISMNKKSNSIGNNKNNNILNNLKESVGIGIGSNNLYNNNINFSNGLSNIGQEKFDINQYNTKSVSYLANYTNRYNSLKEIAKPIIGTNQIQLFSPNNKKIIRKSTTLNKEVHGYNLFPEGCRHILVEDNLYIIGGTNHVRNPISIVLVYHLPTGELKRLPDLNNNHSYHTVEYLENYDSIICIGGENSSYCEIMNLENKKWYKLPNLNIPRANCNIYFNNVTNELFVLFGICGIMSEKGHNYSDSIEVLVLNDISQGWLKVDYYKTPGLNLKVNYCMTIPFTRNQLLIYGGSNMRSLRQNIYALFHMLKSECNKVDTQTMELIKLEEKKSRLVDLALTKLS